MSKEKFNDFGPGVAYPWPIPLPTALPTDPPHVSLCLNHDWLPIVAGALKVLLDPATFDADDATFEASRQDIWNLIQNWSKSCVNDVQFRQIDNCILQVSFDGGVTWTTIYDGSTCVHALVPNTQLPQTLGPPVPLVCTDYPLDVPANGAAVLPVPVNAGDTLSVTAHATEYWSDSVLGVLAGTNFLYCPDGTIAEPLIAGCGAGESAHTGDPLMTANHMEVILNINNVYYRVMAGTITVPAGVVNAQAFFVPNDGDLSDNYFAVNITVEHCAVGWTHTFDFTVSDGGWTIRDDTFGQYVAGVGWQSLNKALHVQTPALLHAGTLTNIEFHYTVPVTDTDPSDAVQVYHIPSGGGANLLFSDASPSQIWAGTIDHFVQAVTQAYGIGDLIYNHCPDDLGTLNLVKCILTGQGSDPFVP